MKISEAFGYYQKVQLQAGGRSLNTYENYKYAAKSIIQYLGDIDICTLTFEQVVEYNLYLTESHVNSTIRSYLTCLKAVLGLCKRHNLDVIDPEDVKVPKPSKEEPIFLDEEEVWQLIDIAGRPARGYPAINRFRNVLIIKMLFQTGLRVGELCALNRDSIHNRQFSVTGKSKETRPCFITSEIEEMIKEYLSMRSDDNRALFVSSQTGGTRISKKTVQNLFRRIRKECPFGPIHPHTMRHSYGTYLIEHGVDIRDVAKLMGHQSLNTTKIYTHVRDSRLRGIYESVMV